VAAAACSLRCARFAASASRLVPPSAFAFPTLQVVVVLRRAASVHSKMQHSPAPIGAGPPAKDAHIVGY
jgi:hypothetical protein